MDAKDIVARIEVELGTDTAVGDVACLGAPPQVADHVLIRRIGAGSYGEVWLARSVTGQMRAVKVVARSRFESERPYEREFRGLIQFEPVSRSHGGLVQVLHVGRDDAVGAFYYVMELADPETPAGTGEVRDSTEPSGKDGPDSGQEGKEAWMGKSYRPRTLRSDLALRGRLPVAEVVALGVQLCGALGHLHRHGLVHRDVKPSNVIFVQGLPKLADLGLVATTREARSFVGTEGFIPPEGPGSVKADLFALGRLLYEAATGKDRCAFPELPADLDTWPDRDGFLELNEVLARLCAPDPGRRCANAAEAAGDLNLILAGRSVRRAYGVERRLRVATRFSVVALGVVLLASAVVGIQEMRQRREAALTAAERSLRERAQAAEKESRQQLYTALFEQARATVRSGELGQRVQALDAIRRAATIRNTPELRREAIAALALPDLRFDRELTFGSRYTARALDPSFERIALCEGRGPVVIRSTVEDRVLATLPAVTNLLCYSLTWTGDGRYLVAKRDYASWSDQEDLEVWDTLGDVGRVWTVRNAHKDAWACHPRLPQLLTYDAERGLVIWDLAQGAEVRRLRFFEGNAEVMGPSLDGGRVAMVRGGEGGWIVSIHRTEDGGLLATHTFRDYISRIAWHPKGDRLAATDHRGGVHLMETATGDVRTLGRHRAEAVVATFSPDGDYLFTGGWERSLLCWDLKTLQRAFVVELDSYHIQFRGKDLQCGLLTPEGVQIHTFERPAQRRFVEDLGSRLRLAALSPDGRWLAASADARLAVWDLEDDGPAAYVEGAAQAHPYWSEDGTDLFACRYGDACFRWKVQPAETPGSAPRIQRMDLTIPEGFVWLSVRSNRVAWTTERGSQIVDLQDVAPRGDRWTPTGTGINAVSPDQRWFAVYKGYSKLLHLYRLPELAPVAIFTNQAAIGGFQFSPTSAEIAVASRGQVEFWSTETLHRVRHLDHFAGIPYVGVLAQPDGRGWWLAEEQRFASLHQADSLEVQLPLPSAMSPIAVSADGRHLVVSADARQLHLWDLERLRQQLRDLGIAP